MKKLLLQALTSGMFVSLFAQNPLDPCCNIIAKDIKTNLVVARDKTTGRLSCFKTDNLDINGIRKGDAVTINLQSKKITSIGGAVRNYNILQPDNAEPLGILTTLRIDNAEPLGNTQVDKAKPLGATPCCGIVSIEPDPLEPCCSVVSFKNNSSGALSRFKAPKNISSTLKVGQPVYADPVNGLKINNLEPVNGMKINNVEPVNGLAIVQSPYGNNNGGMSSYGYPASSGNETTGNSNASDKWVITPVPNMKGVLGKLNSSFPAGVRWTMDIYTQTENKMVNLITSNHNIKTSSLSPGEYAIKFTGVQLENVPVEKGKETRIKAGFLNVVSDGSWDLYDAAKEHIHTSNTKPEKIALPVGSYQLKMGGQYYPVVIKDKETVEF